MRYLAAAVQLNSTADHGRNHASLVRLVRRAASYGATFVATPEATNYLGPHDEKVRTAQPLDGPLVGSYRDLASALGITLLIGSVNEAAPGHPERCYNTSVLIGPDGAILGTYRKLHLFDVDVSDAVRFFESDTTVPGDQVVVVDSPVGRIGLSICYDLRFPELYRRLVDGGAQVLAVPSAFTLETGKDHWQPLLRARAIETQAWVIAPGQVGHHGDRGLRRSWGHSLLANPWGDVVGMAADGEGLALAEIDLSTVQSTRTGMPLASHRRL